VSIMRRLATIWNCYLNDLQANSAMRKRN